MNVRDSRRVWDSRVLLGILLANAAAAYSFFGVPVPWVAAPLLLFYSLNTGALSTKRKLASVVKPLLVFTGLAIVMTAYTWPASPSMPPLATTTYELFLVLRYATLAIYALGIVVFYRYTVKWGEFELCNLLTQVGLLVAGYSLYVYLAQLVGFWEIPRTRMGTGGQDFTVQAVKFQYEFHRALGSFREPSHLAEWLIVPAISSLAIKTKRALVSRIVMLAAIVLSGSLLAVFALAGAWLTLVLIGLSSTKSTRRTIVGASALVLCVVYIFDAVVGLGYLQVIQDRINDALRLGVEGTNRAYVFHYVVDNPPSLVGYGLGNASLKLTKALGTDLVASHLSLYVHYLYALGIIGVALLVWHFTLPLILAIRHGLTKLTLAGQAFVAGHVSWLLMYAGHSEEPALLHAAAVGALVALVARASLKKHAAGSSLYAARELKVCVPRR